MDQRDLPPGFGVMVYCSRHRQLLGTVLAEGFASFLETLRMTMKPCGVVLNQDLT
jgi:hypothetical protein